MAPPRFPTESLDLYLQDIAAYPVPTREEEAELGRRIRAGDDRAVDELVTRNLRFVVSVARGYRNCGLGLADLVNEGNVGLMRAARRFDETRGVRFVTYAGWWVRQAIAEALNRHGRAVRTPRGRRRAYAVSLDAPVPDRSGEPLVERLPDPATDGSDGVAERRILRDALERCLLSLPERERRVLRLVYGLDDGTPRSLAEAGRELGVSRVRVRQIRDRALQRLRRGGRRRYLSGQRG